jgi:hypothetical protein
MQFLVRVFMNILLNFCGKFLYDVLFKGLFRKKTSYSNNYESTVNNDMTSNLWVQTSL